MVVLSRFIEQEHIFGIKFEFFRTQPCWFTLYQQRAEKGWLMAHDVVYTSATHAGCVHDVIDLVKMAVLIAMLSWRSNIFS